jgi:DNA segregation ATPase FtsK/SpoIIIE, S-DNA-T family
VSYMIVVLTAATAAVLARLGLAVYRFAVLPPAGKRNWLAARWARLRWRWLVHNLGLAYLDHHRKAARRPHFPGTSIKVHQAEIEGLSKLRFPRARFTCDEFGIIARVKTVPNVDRAAFDKQAVHIANAWKCHRAQVHQDRPGRLVIRGLRRDPLTVPYPAADAPPGVYGSAEIGTASADLRLYLGRDEWAGHRWFPLKGTAGITVGGLPDYGKTSLVLSWLAQLAPAAGVQFVFIDGKGGGDYVDWAGRAWLFTGDDLHKAASALEDVHALMRARLAAVARPGQVRNRWHIGPVPSWPLIVTVIDECHTFLADPGKGAPAETARAVAICRTMTGELVRKGRSVLFLTILVTQKQTSDAIPTAIRDNCRLGVSFAARTRDAAVAALGEHIREYPSYCPTGLLDPAYVGVATCALPTGHDPFVRLRVPELTEEAAAARAAGTAHLRCDPRIGVPASIPVVPVSPVPAGL